MTPVTFGVQFGVWPTEMPSLEQTVAFAVAAEELNYDAVWLGDHVLLYTPVLEPLCVLAALAMETKQIKLGTSVLLLPLRSPAVVAKSVATVDCLSRGRMILGVGIGGENPKEFDVCGVPLNERGARANEAIPLLRRLWTEDEVAHRGRFWQFEGVTMKPRPVQLGGPPIWVGGRSDAGLKRAGRLGDGWMGYLLSPERFGESITRIREHARQAGRNLEGFTSTANIFLSIAGDHERARDRAAEYLGTVYNQPFRSLVDRLCVVGTLEECARRLALYVEAGAQHIALRPTVGPSAYLSQLEVAAKELIPRVRELIK